MKMVILILFFTAQSFAQLGGQSKTEEAPIEYNSFQKELSQEEGVLKVNKEMRTPYRTVNLKKIQKEVLSELLKETENKVESETEKN